MMKRLHRRVIAAGLPPYFMMRINCIRTGAWAFCPSSSNPYPLQEVGHVCNFLTCWPDLIAWPFHLLPEFPDGKPEGLHSVSALLPNAWAKTLEATVSELAASFLRRVCARLPSWRRLTHSTSASRGPPRGFVQAQGLVAWNWTLQSLKIIQFYL